MGHEHSAPEIARLIEAFRLEKIRFQIVGMSAAFLQGVPVTTLDTDIWIDLPERLHARALHIVQGLGGSILSRTVAGLQDGTLINFLYRVDGLKSFDVEFKGATEIRFHGKRIKVLPIQRIIVSKKFVGREKDIAHLPILKATLTAKMKSAAGKRKQKTKEQ